MAKEPEDELIRALVLAERMLDRPHADPDDDLNVLARQLTRICSSILWAEEEGQPPDLVREWIERVRRAVEVAERRQGAR